MASGLQTHFQILREADNEFYFITDTLVKYRLSITLSPYLEEYPEIVYEFSFFPDGLPSRFSDKISTTIITFLRDIFSINHSAVIVFICESSDSRELSRYRLFNKWFKKYGQGFVKLDAEISIDENIVYYHSVLTTETNPDLPLLRSIYLSSIAEMNNKNG